MIYLLGLESDKFYVGYSKDFNNIAERIWCHFNGYGSSWTKLYKPLRVMLVYGGTPDDERVLTLYLMHTLGVSRVRGSQWVMTYEINLPSFFYVWNHVERQSLIHGFEDI